MFSVSAVPSESLRMRELDKAEVPSVTVSNFPSPPSWRMIERYQRVLPRTAEASIGEAVQIFRAKFKLRKRVVFVEDLPRNTIGKEQKNLLLEQFSRLYSAAMRL